QLVERLIRNQQVAGSTPAGGSSLKSRASKPASRGLSSFCQPFVSHTVRWSGGIKVTSSAIRKLLRAHGPRPASAENNSKFHSGESAVKRYVVIHDLVDE